MRFILQSLSEVSSQAIPPLDEILQHYEEKRLLAHAHMVREFAPRIKELPTTLHRSDVDTYVALLTVWPLVERYNLLFESIGKDLTIDDKRKLDELRKKFHEHYEGEDRTHINGTLANENSTRITFLNPYHYSKQLITGTVLSVMCEPLQAHMRNTSQSHTKLLHDAQMGGTLYTLGIDPQHPPLHKARYSFLQRSFICIDAKGEPVLFMDNIEGGEEHYKKLDHWRGYDEDCKHRNNSGRIHHVYEGVAAAMYLADHLGIRTIIPRDYELTELMQQLGARERTIFGNEQKYRKIGLHANNAQTSIYTHTLFRGNPKNRDGHLQTRFRTISSFPYKTPSAILNQLTASGKIITDTNAGRRKIYPRTEHRLDAILGLYDVLRQLPGTPSYIDKQAVITISEIYNSLGKQSPLPYTS